MPGFVILPGGLPIQGGGTVVAGIGVSGAPSGDIDATCVTTGIQAIS
ncbi:MAG TPA: heme-binding protein [Mycobacteriales bacterium]|nr:heme-binding protein [Mycobacteriales bacterium]